MQFLGMSYNPNLGSAISLVLIVISLCAIGGGKCIDTVKCAGNQLNIPVYTIPTIASTCAYNVDNASYVDEFSFKDLRLDEHFRTKRTYK